ncbi:uncharacterized protein LOC113466270 [Diaphorina citri]|jgi:Uncharacterized conserved protein, contains RING Zn-finger|uniref:Uncharacterized protein LOC113466270 n=1 Tax=Diaphorina citri TaxID=121845 RepID=A0A3Q0ILX9_DIACI|nr:uncharacterized protein LOC113466270 [Diaphorina citri]
MGEQTNNNLQCETCDLEEDSADIDIKCKLCCKVVQDAVSVICGHWFCSKCLDKYFRLVQKTPKVCPVCEYAITDEEKHLSYVDRELELSSTEKFYKAWTNKYQTYSDFPTGEWDNWSAEPNDEDVSSVDSRLVDPGDNSEQCTDYLSSSASE